MAKAISLSADCSKKASGLTVSERDEEQGIGTPCEAFDEACFVVGGGHELRRLPQHEGGFGEERSPKSDELLSIAYRGATNDNVRLRGHLTFDMSGGPKGAKRPLGRPLDGGVRRQRHHISGINLRFAFNDDRCVERQLGHSDNCARTYRGLLTIERDH